MKKFFAALGKAILYFLAYFIPQFSVTYMFMFGYIFMKSAQAGAAGTTPNVLLITTQAYSFMMNHTGLILIISAILTLLIYIIVSLIRKKNFFTSINITKIKPIGIAPIILLGLFFNLFVVSVLNVIPIPENVLESYSQASAAVLGGNGIITFISTVISAPILEEIVFRGFVYQRLKKGMPLVVAAIITSVLFAMMHGNLLWGVYTFLLSVLFIWVYETFHSLLATILLHMFFNLAGELMSNFGSVLDNVNTFILLAVSLVVCVLCIFWIVKLNPKKKEAVQDEAAAFETITADDNTKGNVDQI